MDRELEVMVKYKTKNALNVYYEFEDIKPNGVAYVISTVTAVDENGRPTETSTTSKSGLDNFRKDNYLVGNYYSLDDSRYTTAYVGFQYINPNSVNYSFSNPKHYNLIRKVDYDRGQKSFSGLELDFRQSIGYQRNGVDYYYPAVGPYVIGGAYNIVGGGSDDKRRFKDLTRQGGCYVGSQPEYYLVTWGITETNLRGYFEGVPKSQFYIIGNGYLEYEGRLTYDDINCSTTTPDTSAIKREIASLASNINANYDIT